MSAVAMGLLLAAASTVAVMVTQDNSHSATDSGIQYTTDGRTSVSTLTDHEYARLNTTLTSIQPNVSLESIETKTTNEEEKYLSINVNNISSFKEMRNITENKTDRDHYISFESDVFSRNHYKDNSFLNITYQFEGINYYASEKEDLLFGLSEDRFEKLKNNINTSNEDDGNVENNTITTLMVNNGTPYDNLPIKRVKRDQMNYTNIVNEILEQEFLQTTNQQQSQVNKSRKSNQTSDFNSPWKEMEYSEEDISVGVQTVDDRRNTDAHPSRTSTGFHWPPDLQKLYQMPRLHRGMNRPRLYPSDISSAELYVPLTCLVEWEECKMDAECCRPFFCSTLPKFPAIDSLRESTSLEIIQVCSRFKTTGLQDKKQTHFRQFLDSYKRKMLEVTKA